MSTIKVPIISIVIGEGSSGGALALSIADKIVMLENSVYSILSPEGFASILYKDSSYAKDAAEKMKITAQDLENMSIIDEIIEEPKSGINSNSTKTFKKLKKVLQSNLEKMVNIDYKILIENRYEKYRKIGM